MKNKVVMSAQWMSLLTFFTFPSFIPLFPKRITSNNVSLLRLEDNLQLKTHQLLGGGGDQMKPSAASALPVVVCLDYEQKPSLTPPPPPLSCL